MHSGLMKAVVVKARGGVEQLQLLDIPVPTPGPYEVLLQVKAAGVNRPDVLQRLGLYPPPPGANPNLGLEVAGVVVETGEGVGLEMLNRPVMALCNGGGYAQFVCVPAAHCMGIPAGLSFAQAATLPEVYMTVWQNLVLKAKVEAHQSVLIHGGSSGIGTAAIQVCKRLGARVLVTVGDDSKAGYCKALGADEVFNYRTQDWSERALKASGSVGVNVVLDMVAGDYLNRDLACLAPKGMVVVIALLGGRFAKIDAAQLMMKQAVLTGTTLRPQSAQFKAELARQVEAELLSGFPQGFYKTCVEAEFDLAEVAKAHLLMESGQAVGKIVLNANA